MSKLLRQTLQQTNRRRTMGFKVPLKDELQSLKRDFKTGKLIRVCEECGSNDNVKLVKVVRKYLCKKCRKGLK